MRGKKIAFLLQVQREKCELMNLFSYIESFAIVCKN